MLELWVELVWVDSGVDVGDDEEWVSQRMKLIMDYVENDDDVELLLIERGRGMCI